MKKFCAVEQEVKIEQRMKGRCRGSGHSDRHGEFWVPTGSCVGASYGGLVTAVNPAYAISEPGPFKNTIQGCDEEWRGHFSAVYVCLCNMKKKAFQIDGCGFLPRHKERHTSPKCLCK